MTEQYHYFYSITNNLNQKMYLGIHTTFNLEDGYMGSGALVRKAIIKYGKENFTKNILKFFRTREETLEYEKEKITLEIVIDRAFYNRVLGGIDPFKNLVRSKNLLTKEEQYLPPSELDENWVAFSHNKFIGKDNEGNSIFIDKDDSRVSSGEIVHFTKNTIPVRSKETGKYLRIERNNFDGKIYDLMWTGKKHRKESKEKLGKKVSQLIFISHLQSRKTKRILPKDLNPYLQEGWIKGRKFGVHNAGENKKGV